MPLTIHAILSAQMQRTSTRVGSEHMWINANGQRGGQRGENHNLVTAGCGASCVSWCPQSEGDILAAQRCCVSPTIVHLETLCLHSGRKIEKRKI